MHYSIVIKALWAKLNTPIFYNRTFHNNEKVYSANIQATWISESHNFWYLNSTAKGKEYMFVNTEKGTSILFNHHL